MPITNQIVDVVAEWRDQANTFREHAQESVAIAYERCAERLEVLLSEHAATLLAQIEFTVEVDGVDHFSTRGAVDFRHLGHVVSEEIHVLHRQHRQFDAEDIFDSDALRQLRLEE